MNVRLLLGIALLVFFVPIVAFDVWCLYGGARPTLREAVEPIVSVLAVLSGLYLIVKRKS